MLHQKTVHAVPLGGLRVLVVDDDLADAAATRVILESGGYASQQEDHGDEVLRLVRAELMRFVVSEIYIKCSEGPCVVTALKLDRLRLPRLRVLVYTRHARTADREWALHAGSDAFVSKSVTDRVLLREVGRLDGLAADGAAEVGWERQ